MTSLLWLITTLSTVSSASLAAGENIITDPSMEGGSKFWKSLDYGSKVVSDVARTGKNSIRLTHDGSGVKGNPPTHNIIQSGIPGVSPGKEYIYTVWVKGQNVTGIDAGGKPMSVLRWRDGGNNKLANELFMWAPYKTYDWQPITIHMQTPPNAKKVDVSFRSWWDVTGGISYWDDASLVLREFPNRGARLASYQAEDGKISGGKVERHEPDYTGSGYVKPNPSGGTIEWTNVDGGADGGRRIISVRYSHEGNQKNMELFVNGASQGAIKPAATGRISSWASHDWEVTLRPGNNTVRLRAVRYTAGPLLDRIDVFETRNAATKVARPDITPNGGTISDTDPVSISTSTPGASIFFTTDGTSPLAGAKQYTGPFTLAADATVKAFAQASGLTDSTVASATFTVTPGAGGKGTPVPAIPSAPRASDGLFEDRVAIEWDAVANADSYKVYRCATTATDSCGAQIASPTGMTHEDFDALPGVTYHYRLKACNAAGCSRLGAADAGMRAEPLAAPAPPAPPPADDNPGAGEDTPDTGSGTPDTGGTTTPGSGSTTPTAEDTSGGGGSGPLLLALMLGGIIWQRRRERRDSPEIC